MLDHSGSLPSFITVTDGKCHDINIVRDKRYGFPALSPDSIITVDRGYIDYKWHYTLTKKHVTFITRTKSNMRYTVVGQHREPNTKRGVISDDVVVLTNYYQKRDYPDVLRIIKYYDKETNKELLFFTNNFTLSARTIADLYKGRWEIESFFRWIKQHLRIKTFLGTSKNAVMIQVWIAMIYYVLLSFIKFQTKYSYSMLELARTVRELLLEKVSLIEILRMKYEHYKRKREETIQLSFL